MTLDELRKTYRDSILKLAKTHHIENVRVFGSVASGTATAKSDIDFLVDLGKKADLFDLGGFYYDMSNLFEGQKIDVVPESSVHWYIKDQVVNEAKPL